MVFGDGNRGNVLIFNQKHNKFLMIGDGQNKNLWLMGNVVAFLEVCILSKKKNGLIIMLIHLI